MRCKDPRYADPPPFPTPGKGKAFYFNWGKGLGVSRLEMVVQFLLQQYTVVTYGTVSKESKLVQMRDRLWRAV